MIEDASTPPLLRTLSRREFVSCLLLLGSGFVLAPRAGAAPPRSSPPFQRHRLPDRPSQNPAFRAQALPNGEALL